MSIDAIVMMVLAMLLLWGGLGLAVVNLTRRSDPDEPRETESLRRDL